jgi:hypothetical protein
MKATTLLLMLLGLSACAEPQEGGKLIMCAQDAQQCPDGSWVGRSGIRCEFVCPENGQ